MAEKNQKKRKLPHVEREQSPKKNGVRETSNDLLQVNFIGKSEVAKPVITSGLSLPPSLRFEAFVKRSPPGHEDLFLHSSMHPAIDYNAQQDLPETEQYLKQYIAVFDPAVKTLHITQAKKLRIRSTLRLRQQDAKNDKEKETVPVMNYTSRTALTQEFGTKKSKKAVQSIAENRLLARGGDDSNDPLSNAILSSMPSPEPAQDMSLVARANKPLPPADLSTNIINDVYAIDSLVIPHPTASTLESMPIAHWRDSVSKNRQIKSSSGFVSHRVPHLMSAHLRSPENMSYLRLVQLHRYIFLLIQLHEYLRTINKFKNIPTPDAWPPETYTGNFDHSLLSSIVRHFSPENKGLNRSRLMLLQSTILALTLQIPPPSMNAGTNQLVTELTDISLDLAMVPEEVRKLYRELGCKIETPKPADLDRWGLQVRKLITSEKDASEGNGGQAGSILSTQPKPKWAVLRFPIEFPKVNAVRARGRSRR